MDRDKRIWYLSLMRAAKVQASLRIRAVSPEPSLLAHTSSESTGTFSQKARSLAPLNGWACAVKICHDGMLEDTNSLDGAHLKFGLPFSSKNWLWSLIVVFPELLICWFVNRFSLLWTHCLLLRLGSFFEISLGLFCDFLKKYSYFTDVTLPAIISILHLMLDISVDNYYF